MTTGERIKDLRIKRHISVDQLAELVGVNRATIYRWENGDIEKMSTEVLKPLAVALRTTPEALMGWGDCPDDLGSYERQLVTYCHQLNEEGRTALLDYAEYLISLGKYKKPTGSDIPGGMAQEA